LRGLRAAMDGTSAGLDEPLAFELTLVLTFGEIYAVRRVGDSRKGAEECCCCCCSDGDR